MAACPSCAFLFAFALLYLCHTSIATILSKRNPITTVADGVKKAKKKLLCYFETLAVPTQSWKEDDLHHWHSNIEYYDKKWDIPPDATSLTDGTLPWEIKALYMYIMYLKQAEENRIPRAAKTTLPS